MRKQKFGNSDLLASVIGLGCMGMSEWYGPTNDEESVATIHSAFGLGLNFFDTADVIYRDQSVPVDPQKTILELLFEAH